MEEAYRIIQVVKLKEPDVVIWADKANFLGSEDKSKIKRINTLVRMLVDANIEVRLASSINPNILIIMMTLDKNKLEIEAKN